MVEFNPNDVVSIYIDADYETGERCGASGTFQVISVTLTMTGGSELDVTSNFDQGSHFQTYEEVAEALGLDVEKVCFANCDEEYN